MSESNLSAVPYLNIDERGQLLNCFIYLLQETPGKKLIQRILVARGIGGLTIKATLTSSWSNTPQIIQDNQTKLEEIRQRKLIEPLMRLPELTDIEVIDGTSSISDIHKDLAFQAVLSQVYTNLDLMDQLTADEAPIICRNCLVNCPGRLDDIISKL